MATSTIDANPEVTSIIEAENDPDLSLETGNDPELETIKAHVRQMDEEAEKLGSIQSEAPKQLAFPVGSASVDANPGDNNKLNWSLEMSEDTELELIKARNLQMDEEAEKLRNIQSEAPKQMASPVGSAPVDANTGDNNKLNWSLEMSEETELELMKARNLEMEEEAKKLKQIQSEVAKEMTSPVKKFFSAASNLDMSFEEKAQVDARSVYCGNVDYGATAQELEQHFHGCGSIDRVTIMCNKFDGQPKGFAYVEFANKDSVDTAMALDDSLFR